MRPRIAFIGIRCSEGVETSQDLTGWHWSRFSSSILECDSRKIQVIGGVLSENFSRIN